MQNFCYKCMRSLKGASVCPHCGYDNAAAPRSGSPYHLPCGTMLTGRYLVGNVIGEGGFGITYIGLDTTLSKRVAIKEFYPSGAANRSNSESTVVMVSQGKEDFFNRGVERFLVEAKNVAAFSEEEGIVYVLDYFQANGTAYIVMEYLNGETLKDYVNHHGCFSLEQLVSLLVPVMHSLSVIHARGIIHRDISPDNIMYTKRGKLKLMDFGSARYYTNSERQMSVILKQGFAPEEQYRSNGQQGPYTDVYALCATIYACITGKVPVSSLDRLAKDTLQPPSQLGVKVLPYQERALMHGLALHREDRTPDMQTLIKEFTTPTVGNQPVAPPVRPLAPPVMPPVHTVTPPVHPVTPADKTPAKKSKAPLIIVLVAAVVLIGGGIVAAVTLLGGRGNTPDTPTGTQSSQVSLSRYTPSSVSSAADTSDVQSSEETEQSSEEESEPETSVSASAHTLKNEGGVYLLEDNRINTGDVRSEQRLTSYMVAYDRDVSTDEFKYSYFVSGNTLVLQYKYVIDLSAAQVAQLKKDTATLKTNEQVISFKGDLINKADVEDPQIVYAYYTKSGDVITTVIVDD